jgi:hypothetical protein
MNIRLFDLQIYIEIDWYVGPKDFLKVETLFKKNRLEVLNNWKFDLFEKPFGI